MKTAVGRINGLVDALNWMQGFKDAGGYNVALYPLERNLWSSCVDPMRYEVLARLDAAVRRVEEVAPLSPHAALRLLLRGRSPYDVRPGAVSLAPFRLELLSLPDSVHDCPRIESLLPAEALSYMKGYQERMLASSDVEVGVREYLDPALRFNQKRYQALMKVLFDKGLICPVDYAVERVGLFAVWKIKGVSQRLTVDRAVPTNGSVLRLR